MIYVYKIGNCNHPFPPYQSINPLRWATRSEALQPLHKGLKAAEMAREEMHKNMVRVSACLRDFETSTSIQLPGSKVCAVSFFFWVIFFGKMMRISNHEYATTNAGYLSGNIGILELKQYSNFSSWYNWNSKYSHQLSERKGARGTFVMEIEATKVQQLSEEQQQEREERSRRLDCLSRLFFLNKGDFFCFFFWMVEGEEFRQNKDCTFLFLILKDIFSLMGV